jgi:hypothetical protein
VVNHLAGQLATLSEGRPAASRCPLAPLCTLGPPIYLRIPCARGAPRARGQAPWSTTVSSATGTISLDPVLVKLVPGQPLYIALILRHHGQNKHVTIGQSYFA